MPYIFLFRIWELHKKMIYGGTWRSNTSLLRMPALLSGDSDGGGTVCPKQLAIKQFLFGWYRCIARFSQSVLTVYPSH